MSGEVDKLFSDFTDTLKEKFIKGAVSYEYVKRAVEDVLSKLKQNPGTTASGGTEDRQSTAKPDNGRQQSSTQDKNQMRSTAKPDNGRQQSSTQDKNQMRSTAKPDNGRQQSSTQDKNQMSVSSIQVNAAKDGSETSTSSMPGQESKRLEQCQENQNLQEEHHQLKNSSEEICRETEFEKEKKEYVEQIEHLKRENGQLQEKNEKLINQLKEKHDELMAQFKENENKLMEKQERILVLENNLKKEQEFIQDNIKKIEEQEKIIQDTKKKYEDCMYASKAMQTKLNGKIKDLQICVCDRDRTIEELKKERNEIQTRYSQVASEKLNQNNPDIVDLSDPNRAMKLAERYGDIYNEQWTDASEAFTGLKINERNCVNILLEMLMECYNCSTQLADGQLSGLQNLLLYPVQNPEDLAHQGRGKEQPRVSADSLAKLKSLRRKESIGSVKMVQQYVLKMMSKRSKDDRIVTAAKGYILKCAELCWYMVLHDPPLHLGTDAKSGQKVDTTLYTTISKGHEIDYLVWPPLYNGRNGGMLQKGVVEVVKVVTKKGKK